MAFLQFYFSESNRKCLGVTLAFFCTLQMVVGICLCCGSIYFHWYLQWKVLLVEGYESDYLYKLTLSLGILTMFLHLIGGKICYDCGQIDTRSRFDKVIFLWFLLILGLAIAQFVGSMESFGHTRHARKHFKNGFISTMKNYLSNTKTKEGMDRLQIEHECCGADNYKDWMANEWVPSKFNPFYQNPSLMQEYKIFYENTPLEVKLKENQLIVSPFSCCDHKYMGPCFHDFITQPGLAKTSSSVVKSQWWEGTGLFKTGCASMILDAYNEYFDFTGYFLLFAVGIQILIIILTRYLQTSIDNIPMFGRDNGTAPGWLCECDLI